MDNKKHHKMGLNDLPAELQVEIMARVAADSKKDWVHAKLTCKDLNFNGEDNCSYQRVYVDRSARLGEKTKIKLYQANNPEGVFRKALDEFFTNGNDIVSYHMFEKAILLNHPEARYVYGFVRLFSAIEKTRNAGVKELVSLKAERSGYFKVVTCRTQLKERLRSMWIKWDRFEPMPSFCHSHFLLQTHGFGIERCTQCIPDFEIYYVCAEFPDDVTDKIVLF